MRKSEMRTERLREEVTIEKQQRSAEKPRKSKCLKMQALGSRL